jgi:quinol monooxygenase YgiN
MIQASFRIVTPAHKRVEVLDVLATLKEPTMVSKGCRACHVLQDVNNENILTYIERWDTLADLEDHMRSERFRRLLPYIDLSVEPPEVEFDAIETIHGIELLLAALRQTTPE